MVSNSSEASEALRQVYAYADRIIDMVSTVPTGDDDEEVYEAAYALRERLSDARQAVGDLQDALSDAQE